jgi:HTH-type transcriptional regulator / antitoxin HigA
MKINVKYSQDQLIRLEAAFNERNRKMLNTTKTMTVWAKHANQLNITPPTSKLEYEKLLELIEQITDTVDDLEQNPYSALLDLAMHYASLWEDEHEVITDVGTPKDVLEFWMDQHKTMQKDLERAGVADQPTISKILKGERGISKSIAKALGTYFKVSPAEFL